MINCETPEVYCENCMWEGMESELLHEHLCPRCRVSGSIERAPEEQQAERGRDGEG